MSSGKELTFQSVGAEAVKAWINRFQLKVSILNHLGQYHDNKTDSTRQLEKSAQFNLNVNTLGFAMRKQNAWLRAG